MRAQLLTLALIGVIVAGDSLAAERVRPLASRDGRSWRDKMAASLGKKISVDFSEESLTDVANFVANLTGLNIIVNPKLRDNAPKVTLKVKDMDTGTFLKWVIKLTETSMQIKDQAIFITDKSAEEDDSEERMAILMLGLRSGVTVELPPAGQKMTEEDAMKIASQIFEKEQIKPTNFPAPNFSGIPEPAANPFDK